MSAESEELPRNLTELLDWVVGTWPSQDAWQFLQALDQALTNASAGLQCYSTDHKAEQAFYYEEAGLALSRALLFLREHTDDYRFLGHCRRLTSQATGLRLSVTLLAELWEPVSDGEKWTPYEADRLAPIHLRIQAIDRAREVVQSSLVHYPSS
jgi:hypothetical protein